MLAGDYYYKEIPIKEAIEKAVVYIDSNKIKD